MASNVPPMPGAAGAPVAPKKTSPVVWVLLGCGVLVVLIAAGLMVAGLFVAHKVRQAGFDSELIQRHPELAAVKMMVAANPDAELVSIDENRGVVSIRDKKTGKVVTLNFEDIKKGRMTLEADGQKVSIEGHGQGDTGSVVVNSPEGSATLGAGAVKLPAWLPAYPGTKAQGFSTQGASGSAGGFGFKTGDSPDQVATFYSDELKKAGLKVELMKHPTGAILNAEAGSRKAVVNVMADGSGASVSGTFEEK
jgi:hypothetical protein